MLRVVAGLAGVSVAAAIALAAPAEAQDTGPEPIYSAYHRAIRAAELCEKRRFDQDAHVRMALFIDERIDHALGAGPRLRLIEQTKSEMRERIGRYGCQDPAVQEALALFHGELEPTLQ